MAENIVQYMAEGQEKGIALHEEAIRLHLEIRNSASLAAEAIVDFASGLKKMRDTQLYTELGFETFGDYTERAVGIKQSMAYNWIRVLENLTPEMIKEKASIGITKLQLLTQVPALEREDFTRENDLEEMTVAELKEELKKYKDQGEQLSLLQEELADRQERAEETDAKKIAAEAREQVQRELRGDIERANAAKEQAEKEVERLKKEAESAKKEAERATKTKIAESKEKIEAEAKKAALAEAEEKIKAAKSEGAAEVKANLDQIEREKARAIERAEALEKRLKVASDPVMVKFTFYFEAAQTQINKLIELIGSCEDAEKAEKLRTAVTALLTKTTEAVEGE